MVSSRKIMLVYFYQTRYFLTYLFCLSNYSNDDCDVDAQVAKKIKESVLLQALQAIFFVVTLHLHELDVVSDGK